VGDAPSGPRLFFFHTIPVQCDGERQRTDGYSGLVGRRFPPTANHKEAHMGAREIEFDQTAVLRIGSLSRVGYVRTRKTDPERPMRRNGDSVALSGEAAIPAAAYESPLLELYRKNPTAVIERVEREARKARAQHVGEWIRRIFE
jgi:hypothetical protein